MVGIEIDVISRYRQNLTNWTVKVELSSGNKSGWKPLMWRRESLFKTCDVQLIAFFPPLYILDWLGCSCYTKLVTMQPISFPVTCSCFFIYIYQINRNQSQKSEAKQLLELFLVRQHWLLGKNWVKRIIWFLIPLEPGKLFSGVYMCMCRCMVSSIVSIRIENRETKEKSF